MADFRAKKSGIGADIERKRELRYDEEEKAGTMDAVQLWVNAVTQGEHDSIPSSSQKELHRSLKDGVQLCKLVNKLLASKGGSAITFQKKVASPFVAMNNIDNFNKGCQAYGLKDTDLVQSADLWEGRKGPFLNVINCIHSLGCLANGAGFMPSYTGTQTKMLDLE